MTVRHPDEDRIRALAFQFWQQEGCPEGCAEDHWQRACDQVEAENAAPPRQSTAKPKGVFARLAATTPEPAAAPKRARTRASALPVARKGGSRRTKAAD